MNIGSDFEIIEDPKAPKGRRIVRKNEKAPEPVSEDAGIGTDSGDQFSDEQLRDAIEQATGKAPHPNTGRVKLIAQFNELNSKA